MKTDRRSGNRPTTLSKLVLATVTSVGVATLAITAAAAAPPIYVDGKPTAVAAIVRHNQVFVPIRGVFENLDARVTYLVPRTIVVARKGNGELVRLAVGNRSATVNGAHRTLATAPFLSRSRVFVPLRLISEAAGATVVYSASPHSVRIDKARALVAAAPVAVASVARVAAPVVEQAGIPWWVWLLLGLIALGILLAFLLRRRKPDPIIITRSSPSDPNITTRR